MERIDLGDQMGAISIKPGTWFHLLETDNWFLRRTVSNTPGCSPTGGTRAGVRLAMHSRARLEAIRL